MTERCSNLKYPLYLMCTDKWYGMHSTVGYLKWQVNLWVNIWSVHRHLRYINGTIMLIFTQNNGIAILIYVFKIRWTNNTCFMSIWNWNAWLQKKNFLWHSSVSGHYLIFHNRSVRIIKIKSTAGFVNVYIWMWTGIFNWRAPDMIAPKKCKMC